LLSVWVDGKQPWTGMPLVMLRIALDQANLIKSDTLWGQIFCRMRLTLPPLRLKAGLQGFYRAALSP
jgi:hypothetical protein